MAQPNITVKLVEYTGANGYPKWAAVCGACHKGSGLAVVTKPDARQWGINHLEASH